MLPAIVMALTWVSPPLVAWAKRGVALRNMWSSLPTSRSVESLLFAQIPYDSTVKTGTSGGWTDTKLFGLPQLFTAKGYETFFTTGCGTTFDGWDSFFSAHGYDTVWSNLKMIELANKELGITRDQWFGPEHRGFQWGVHDDISFKFLGDLLMEKPDFSALYEGKNHERAIKRYLDLRYFTDMELGKFLDRMAAEGILNDTIVVIVGDHGQAPEADLWNIHEDSVRRVASAIIAEGRLGDAVGLVIDDAAEQYDILNTLADITGVPEGGLYSMGLGDHSSGRFLSVNALSSQTIQATRCRLFEVINVYATMVYWTRCLSTIRRLITTLREICFQSCRLKTSRVETLARLWQKNHSILQEAVG
ncbi:Alkaline-phosphatase-like, core domain [Phytophthora cactorum]|nr:Alkaline-phosphatase-like, core domain [Phytophthora cactorum]